MIKLCKCGCGEEVTGIRESRIFVNPTHNKNFYHNLEKLKPKTNICL